MDKDWVKKDVSISLRVNKNIKELLTSKGYSMQAIFDEAIGKLVSIKTEVKIKKDKK